MHVTELSRDQLTELKQNHLIEQLNSCSWGDLANVDEIISDEVIFELYNDYIFVDDDFSV